jgi:hypothetical protein
MIEVMTFDEIMHELEAAGALFKEGKGGLWVTKTANGAIIQNLNKDAKPVRFSQAQIDWLVQRFPYLADTLSRNMETMRRVQGLRSRLAAFLGGSFLPAGSASSPPLDEAAKLAETEKKFLGSLPSRKYAYLESLDPDLTRKMPASLEEVQKLSVQNPEKLPRNFTVVDVTDPKKPVRHIFQIEFDTGGLRTDEAMISYTVSPKEMDLLQKGETFKTHIRGVEAENLRVFYSDINKPIQGETLFKHHQKTLDTLSSVAKKFFTDFEIKLIGPGTFISKEVYLQPMQATITGSTATIGRAAEASALEAIDKATTTCVKFEPATVAGELRLIPQFEARGMAALRHLPEHQLQQFILRLGKIGDELAAVIKKNL